jgi:cytochrome b561
MKARVLQGSWRWRAHQQCGLLLLLLLLLKLMLRSAACAAWCSAGC